MINCRYERFFRGSQPYNLFKSNARRIMLTLTLVPDVDETSSAILTALLNRFFFTSRTTDLILLYSARPAPGRFINYFFKSIMTSIENRANFTERFHSLRSFNSNSLRSVKVWLPIFKKSITLHNDI